MLQSLLETLNYFGPAQLLNTHLAGNTFCSTVAYNDFRDTQRALNGLKARSEFQNIVVYPVVETDFAVTVSVGDLHYGQHLQLVSDFTDLGAIALQKVTTDDHGKSQLMVFYYNNLCVQKAISMWINTMQGSIHPSLTGVAHSHVCTKQNFWLPGPLDQDAPWLDQPHDSVPRALPLTYPSLPSGSPSLKNGELPLPRSSVSCTPFGISSPPIDDSIDTRWYANPKAPHASFQGTAVTPPFKATTPSIWSTASDAADLGPRLQKGQTTKGQSPPPELTMTSKIATPPDERLNKPAETVGQATVCAADKRSQLIVPPQQPLHGVITRDKVPYNNVVDLDLIDSGKETRTTIMLRNIPNKFSQRALKEFLDVTNRHTYNFLYLRMDFDNHCNVGYAFICFTHPKHIATFARARCGQKWNLFKSEKMLDLSFAKIQGRSALINKFRISPVMNEPAEYRPKLYHTSGPLMGEEEPFPVAKR